MNMKWTKILAIVGLVAGVATPQNREVGLHVIAFAIPWVLFFAFVGLVIDFIRTKVASTPSPETHVKCPDCREFVMRDARKCKHCGCKLIPQ